MYKLSMILCFSMATSCATVRVVKSQPGRGGELAIQNGLFGEPASVLAERAMASNCANGYIVTEEGETVIGSKSRTNGSEETQGSALASKSSKSSSSETSTQDVTEWRMKYKCKKASKSRS